MCEFDSMPIGARIFRDAWRCLSCDTRGQVQPEYGTFVGNEGEIHLLKMDNPIVCGNCGHRNDLIRVPCGSDMRFEIVAYPIENTVFVPRITAVREKIQEPS